MNLVVRARGVRELRSALKDMEPDLAKELRRVWLRAAKLVEARANSAAPARIKKGVIRGMATQRAARLSVRPRRGDELAVFLGQTRRSGWYSRLRYRGSKGRQFRPWVGNQWDPGETGGKPYFIGDAVNESVDDVVELVADGVDDVARRAGFH